MATQPHFLPMSFRARPKPAICVALVMLRALCVADIRRNRKISR
jgi:hypothetical protein